ncbi:GDP-L-fucose synthase [Candidatus Pelagibacter ubique]|nr:GDP-L-fucose synthase [Candidatus Pelagibacter ubique]
MITKDSKIFLTGHKGLVGSAIHKKLLFFGYKNIIIADRKKLDLKNQSKVNLFIKKNKPELVIIAAGKVGGIMANSTYPGEFIYDNLMIACNLINSSFKNNIKNLIFLGSSCIYPSNIKRKILEKDLLKSYLEKTNEAYAIAKIAGVKLCEFYNKQYKLNYLTLMPTNIYGPDDNYDLEGSHFIPALIKKIHLAKINNKKSITLWGNGKSRREILYVDDLAESVLFFMKKKTKHTLINIGTGKDMTIEKYAKKIMSVIGYNTKIKYDKKKPNGTFRKVLNISLAKMYGWQNKTNINVGLQKTYKAYIKNFK